MVLDFAPDPATECMVAIEAFEELPAGAESPELRDARELLRAEGGRFDERVRSYYAEQSRSL